MPRHCREHMGNGELLPFLEACGALSSLAQEAAVNGNAPPIKSMHYAYSCARPHVPPSSMLKMLITVELSAIKSS